MSPFEDRLEELTAEQRELFELFLKRERLSVAAVNGYRSPKGAVESTLAEIWQELLGVEAGVDDNYFELGGDSLTIIRMVSSANRKGISLQAAWVFSHPTIAELAALSESEKSGVHSPARTPDWKEQVARIRDGDPDFNRVLGTQFAEPVDAYPLTPLQQGLLYHSLEDTSAGTYKVRWRFRLKGRLDVARFRNVWRVLIERHDALRTIFQWTGAEEPMQIVLNRADDSVTEEQCRGCDLHATASVMLDEDGRTGFDLRKAPLARIRLARIAEDEWLCFWTHHHLILDGWSQQVLLEEFFAAYSGDPLPPVVSGVFREHVYRQRRQDQSTAVAFWRRELAGYRPPQWPVADDAAPGQYSEHSVITNAVPRARDLRQLLSRHGVTLSSFYEALWSIVLTEVLERPDVAFGVTLSGRSSGAPSIERGVGMFINTLPLRVTVDRDLPLTAFVKDVQDRQAQLVEHEWCGLASVQKWIGWHPGSQIINSVYVYEKFPLGVDGLERREGLAVLDIEATTHEHYPLIFVVRDEDDTTTLTLKHCASGAEWATRFERILKRIAAVPERMAAAPQLSIADLQEEQHVC